MKKTLPTSGLAEFFCSRFVDSAAHGGRDAERVHACGDLVPDNGAHTIIVDRCIIDDFYFFPYLDIAPTVHSFYAEMLAVLLPEATRCKLYEQASGISLRAPPVA